MDMIGAFQAFDSGSTPGVCISIAELAKWSTAAGLGPAH